MVLMFCQVPSWNILVVCHLLSAFNWNPVTAGECDGGHSEFVTVKDPEHRIMVEVLNDNKPEFLKSSIQPLDLSELTAVNTVAFTVQAIDADGDTLAYIIDETSPDAGYFRVDLPNSGRVILKKSLDYESKTQLRITLYAVETNTVEHYNTTATIIINVLDGDDQYPQFLPCILLSANHGKRICANPLYTANVTENEQDIVLDFSPGSIQAADGDRGIRTTLTYTILSGADNGRFVMDSTSGEVRLTRRVENRLLTPMLRLRVMAAQVDDPLKYAVATVLVRVLAENRYPPQFNRSAYRGFVSEGTSPASLVMTYGNKLLTMQAVDQDFADGFNPRLQYSLNSENNSSRLFYITQEGLLIAKTNQLHLNHKYFLEVVATDLESGDTVYAALHVEVLQKGQPVPQGPLGSGHPDGIETVGRAEGLAGLCLILLGITLFMLVRCIRRRRKRRDPLIHANVADSKHPNVTLKWFQLMNHGRPMPPVEESFYHNEAFSGYDGSTSPFYGKQGVYTKTEEPPTSTVDLPPVTFDIPLLDPVAPTRPNGKPSDRSSSKTVSFRDFVVVRECEEEQNREAKASLKTKIEACTSTEKVDNDCMHANTDLGIAENKSITGFDTESQLDSRVKIAIKDYDPKDKVNTLQVHTNPDKTTNQHITNPEMLKTFVPEEEQAGDSYQDREKDDTDTEEDATQADFPVSSHSKLLTSEARSDGISKYVDHHIDPAYLATKNSMEKIETGIQE
nr:uncharacterized protein LOC129418864 isoform X1 [Misgurnus anguillicaudatus]XP_055029773.1 uncharacterized protein LOC129418864 isoform X1 [Misgurnus anguillicaudatus]